MNIYQIIIKLLFSSSNKLLKFSFLALPLGLFLSISSYLFIDSILNSYQKYLEDSYLGVQGRIYIETKDKKLINAIKEYASKNHLKYSVKNEFFSDITLVSPKKVLKKSARFIVLDKNYLKEKFKLKDIKSNTLFVNQTFIKSMGSMNINDFKSLFLKDKDKSFKIDKFITENTGFLSAKPMIFISREFAQKIFHLKPRDKQTIEFLEKNQQVVDKIKKEIEILAKNVKSMKYEIHDLIIDMQSTKEFFDKVNMVQNSLSILIFILSVLIIMIGVSIFIELKKESLKILQLLGMSKKDLSLAISGVLFFMTMVVLLLSLFTLHIYQDIFLSITSLNINFFIPLNYEKVYIILGLNILLSLLSYLITNYIFTKATK